MDFQGKLVSKQSICLQTANTNSRHQLSLMTLQLHFVLSVVLFLRNFKSRFYVMSFLPRKDEVPCRAVLKYDKNQWTFQEKFYVKPNKHSSGVYKWLIQNSRRHLGIVVMQLYSELSLVFLLKQFKSCSYVSSLTTKKQFFLENLPRQPPKRCFFEICIQLTCKMLFFPPKQRTTCFQNTYLENKPREYISKHRNSTLRPCLISFQKISTLQ